MDMTNKHDLLKLQEQLPPFGLDAKYTRYIRRIHRTSGTTAKPLIVALNDADIDAITAVGARCFRNAGVIDGMRVVHCLNYAGWIGGYTDHASLERAGACVLPWGVGNTEQLIQMILNLGIESISCTPSYLGVLKKVLKEKFGMNPEQLGLKLGLFGGEAGLQNPVFRQKIEEEWGIDAIDANYGMADVMSIFASENRLTKDGLTFFGNGYLAAQLLVDGQLVDIQKGLHGELVLSTLYQGGLINRTDYRTGDIIEVLDDSANFRFTILGRADEMLVVRGINVYPSTILEIATRAMNEYGIDFFWQLLVSKEDPISDIVLSIQGINRDDELEKYLHEAVRSATGISIKITFDNDAMMSQNMKLKSIVRCL
jgi:phenylacetate-CoA ligase